METLWLEELRALLRIPSNSGNETGLKQAGEWLTQRLLEGGWDVSTGGDSERPPLISAKRGEGPLVVVYSHYDVANPLRTEWKHDPFGAEVVEDRIVACGARDAKANLLGAVHAGEQAEGVSLLLLFEGEEKGESPQLAEFAKRVLAEYKMIGFVCADGGGYTDRDEPTMELGLKGQVALQVDIGPGVAGVAPTSLHSGHAALAANPMDLMARFLASLKDRTGRVTLPGFYESVAPAEKPYTDPLDEAEASFLQTLVERYGYQVEGSESRAALMNRLMFEPELNIASVMTGESGLEKRIVPNRARVHLDINLVPGQNPAAVVGAVAQRLREQGIDDAKCLRVQAQRQAYRCSPDEPLAAAARNALARVHPGKSVVVLPSSGSSGPVSILPRTFGHPLVRVGTGYRGHAHTPDEAIRIEHYSLYVKTLVELFGELRKIV